MTIAVLFIVLLGACSRTELLYNNVDWLAYRWVDGLLDANGTQPERWKLVFATVHEQHRRELLPDVIALLDGLSIQAERGLADDGLRCLWNNGEHLFHAHGRLFVAPGVGVLGDVSTAQVDHLEAAFAERIAEYHETYLQADEAERSEARIERFVERIEFWTGSLNTAQTRMVAAAVQRMPDVARGWLAYREQQQRQLVQLLRSSPDDAALSRFLNAWWVEQQGRDPLLEQRFAEVRDATLGLLVSLDRSLDSAQREHLRRKVASLRDDLRDAAAKGGGLRVAARVEPVCTQVS